MYRLKDNVSFESMDEGGFLINIESGKIFSVNGTATLILEGIKCGKSINHIIDQMFSVYNIDKEIIKSDVNKCVKLLLEYNHIEEIK